MYNYYLFVLNLCRTQPSEAPKPGTFNDAGPLVLDEYVESLEYVLSLLSKLVSITQTNGD